MSTPYPAADAVGVLRATPDADSATADLQALDEARKTQYVLDLVNGYRQAVGYLQSLREHGVPTAAVTAAVTDLDSLLCMALRRSS